VFRLAPEQVIAISELRETLEIAAVEMAMTRHHGPLVEAMGGVFEAMRTAFEAGDTASYRALDASYHETIVAASGNPFLQSAYGLISFQIQALRSRLSREELLNELSFREHYDMLSLARAQRGKALQSLLRVHIRNTRQSYIEIADDGGRTTEDRRRTTD